MTKTYSQFRLAILVSGSGTILQAMIDHGVDISLVAADRPCQGIDKAEAAGIQTLIVDRKEFGWDVREPDDPSSQFDRDEFSRAFAKQLREHGITLVALSGFMTIFSDPFFKPYAGSVINTHPALLPSFPGAHGVRDALRFGVKVTGCTLHLATKTVDYGPILEQRAFQVPDQADLTFEEWEDAVQELVKQIERKLYPQVLTEILNGTRVLPKLTSRYL